ncbi:choice-of-anchor B family protein [Polaribacter sp. Hel1_85]|uniref:choice-of-anchor B family protein n=1 Tax=Polaribacter sp. Hel1_85 TaxID=1250005 RepID=UPI00052BC8D9|nr:choice-of-anchor B family protein [Polaribacter sp. Hel1_85]KGL62537.1 regulator [Polaribacter sp. Hel1_85]
MIKKTFFIILITLIFSCTKNDVFERENQIIINPIAKCENGFAGEYPCNDYDLLTHFTLEEIGGADTTGNNCWGWVDPISKNEYALMCTNKGVTFINITDPANAVIVGTLKTKAENILNKNVKIFKSTAYVVSEDPLQGMQLFNLSRLIDVKNPPVEFTSDINYSAFGKANNIVINQDSGFAYITGTDTFNGGPHFVDLNITFKPAEAGGYDIDSYSNDAQVITYKGPDTDYIDKEILIGSNDNEIVILDVTDKDNLIKISTISYTHIGKSNQGWFTEDFKYFLIGDEKDEEIFSLNTRTIIFDFTDLDNPIHHFDYLGNTTAIDKNGYVKENIYYQTNFNSGVKMIDISNIENKTFTEIGFFDTYPENNNTETNGTWNVYPFLPSGNIIVSDFNRGLFIIRKSNS